MPSIQSLGYPLAYKAVYKSTWPESLEGTGIRLRTEARALDGMQKEALVYYTPSHTVWRMVSDEGPYLNGTDLAPFPLAFYTAGMAFSFVSDILKHAKAYGVQIESIELVQDNFYTMEGSALRGDMIGGALPAELSVKVETDADAAIIQALVEAAAQSSAAQAYNRDVLHNVFSLTHNGAPVPVVRVLPSTQPARDPNGHFEQSPPKDKNPRKDFITKLKSAETLFDVDGGAGSSLKSEQKRTLHVRGIVTQGENGLLECRVQLLKPIGSTFRFLCDYQHGTSAPPPLAYLCAGVGFCFMTQIGRYATIVKQNLQGYRIVQNNAFTFEDHVVSAQPVDTHLFVDMDEDENAAQTLLSMSEQTCFLHAAMRSTCPSTFTLEVNGAPAQATV